MEWTLYVCILYTGGSVGVSLLCAKNTPNQKLACFVLFTSKQYFEHFDPWLLEKARPAKISMPF